MIGLIFNIQRFSIHDGPGIRTTVFFKGCNLHCLWCHNPESIETYPELQCFPNKCIGCLKCVEACKPGAHSVENGNKVFNRAKCALCFKCTEVCNAEVLIKSGREYTVDEVVKECLADKKFYDDSNGGVTASGGEPLLQADFLAEVFNRLKHEHVHTCIQTAGNVNFKTIEKVLPYTDLVMLDIKSGDPEKHKQFTGVSNKQILSNLDELNRKQVSLIIRIPVVPGVNDSPADMEQIAALVKDKNVQYIELLKFHSYASGKYNSLGREYKCYVTEDVAPDKAMQIVEALSKSGKRIISNI
jgi:pyruvate formate lyase activating enzyme